MDINTVLGTATEVATEPKASTEAASENPKVEEKVEVEAPAKVEEDISKKPDSELTPEQLAKREKNRQSHLNSKLAEMRRAKRELEAQVAQLRQQPKPQEQVNNGRPRIEDFADKTWEEYNEALTDWKLEQKFSATNKQSEETQKSQQINQAKAQRVYEVAQAEAEFAKSNPEYAELVNENAAFFSGITPEIAEGLAEADNPTVAIYALMKEGGLDNLFDLTPTKLAAELAKAEIRGETYLKQVKPTTNAPAPITAARGNAVGKSLDKLDGAALLKSIRQN